MRRQLGGRLFAKNDFSPQWLSLARWLNTTKRFAHCRNLEDLACILGQDIMLEKVGRTQGPTLKLAPFRLAGHIFQ